ncbi:MAG: hypothetical protein V4568_09260 [Pseudomonadota bacterium]
MSTRVNRSVLELRWPLIVLALAAVLGGVMMSASWYVEHSKDQEFKQAQNRLRAARLALNNIRRDETDLVAYRERFKALSEHGIFGQEQRLNWVEYMTNLSAMGQLQSLNYEIASQRTITFTPLPQANSIDITASRIQLKMGFLHEEDLMRILEELHQSNAGFYRMESCTVKRKENSAVSKIGENISADCRLQWITMRPKSK